MPDDVNHKALPSSTCRKAEHSSCPLLPFAATVHEAVRLSGLSRTAIYALLNEGKIEARKRGKTTLVLVEGLLTYVDELTRAEFGGNASSSISPPAKR